jgi:aerobic carbon-monoxide dehydrogenase medium subunit
MKPPIFDYEQPTSLREALDSLSRNTGTYRLLAGGYSLMPLLNSRAISPERIIDISRLSELNYVTGEAGAIRIGALATHGQIMNSSAVIKECPIVVEAYKHVGNHTIRNRGTLCGSLCFNDPTAEMPLITSLLGATFVIRSSWGSRTLSANEFFKGPFKNSLMPNEMLVEVRIPRQQAGHGYSFIEISQRYGDRGLAAAGCMLTLKYGVVSDVRIGFRNLGEGLGRVRAVEVELENKTVTAAVLDVASDVARRSVQPETDMHADADYRRDVAATLTKRVIETALARAAGHTAHTPSFSGRLS